MSEPRLAGHSYGKDGIRILTRGRTDGRVFVRDLTLDIRLAGDFGAAFVERDNATILPTDSLRNHAYAAAEELPGAQAETFAAGWLVRLLAAVPAATSAWASVEIRPWTPVGDPAGAVLVPASWSGRAEIAVDRGGVMTTTGGIAGLALMAPFGSGFAGFLRDDLTDQQDSGDRVMAGECEASWQYGNGGGAEVEYSDVRDRVRTALEGEFGVPSSGAQGTVYAMAKAALAAAPELSQITVKFAGRPHSPVVIPRGGRPTTSEVAWSVSARPSGVSEATVVRL